MMIDNLTIQNFRLFESLEIQGITRVNLIVGKNNAGKSALLEAFYLYYSGLSLNDIFLILDTRQEFFREQDGFEKSPIIHLFNNHKLPLSKESNIKIFSNDYSVELGISVVVESTVNGEVFQKSFDFDSLSEDIDASQIHLQRTITYSSSLHRLRPIPLNERLSRLTFRRSLELDILITKSLKKICRLVPTKGLMDNTASSLWDSISLTPAQDDVIKAFHLIEPKITGLSFVAADSETNNRIPIIKLSDMSEPIPLKSLGDGMTRLFHLILSLVTAKDGVLLIDEFENGLHWSTQSKAWQLIFTLAKQWNVQVFCTTHSTDCINGFEEIWTQNPQDAAFFRLYRKDNQSYIKTYDLEMLSDAIETETEVR